jgi:sterol desaturase/sphingolipid hydroxylase (fatty acid hydroxylase superfamily)
MLYSSVSGEISSQFHGSAAQISWFLIAFAMVAPLEAYFGSERKVTWKERGGNFAAMLVHVLVGGLELGLAMATPFGRWLDAYPREPRLAVLRNPYVWAFASVFLVDAAFYCYHRLQHAIPAFWRVHKMHHTDPAMNITTSRRSHFLERALQYFCLSIPMFWALGMNLQGMALAAAVTTGFLYFGHADIRIDLGFLTPVVVGPMYHRLHHSRLAEHQDVNFAQAFPVFDIIGGTYRRPRWDEYPETGIEGYESASARWRPMLW